MKYTMPELCRSDLMEMEPLLSETLQSVLPFKTHALYFPQEDKLESAEWLPRERKILIPLRSHDGHLLGVFMAGGVNGRQARSLLSALPAVARMAMDKAAFYKAGRLDSVTGILRDNVLLETMAGEAELVKARLRGLPEENEAFRLEKSDTHRLCMGLITLNCTNFDLIVRRRGFAFADKILRSLADAVVSALPTDVSAARTGQAEFTLLLPSSGRKSCRNLAQRLLKQAARVTLTDKLTHQKISASVSCGYAVYPQDMKANELALPMFEQSRILLTRSRTASQAAADGAAAASVNGAVCREAADYAKLLQTGGFITDIGHTGNPVINLGQESGAAEGMRFSVHRQAQQHSSGSTVYLGEIILTKVHEKSSTAEICHLDDPAAAFEKGDAVVLLERDGDNEGSHLPLRKDPDTGLLVHNDFMRAAADEAKKLNECSLAIVRIEGREDDTADIAEPASVLTELLRNHKALVEETNTLSVQTEGRYGNMSLAFLHSTADREALSGLYADLARQQQSRGVKIACGFASYPFLRSKKTDLHANALKALDCALLLPFPHVSSCDSVALNVSADKLYEQGDLFNAIAEYKQALLADEGNTTAWNSLGVCAAAIGQAEQARHYFEEAAARAPMDAAVQYNMGTLLQTLHDDNNAKKHYRRCLQLDPSHAYAHIRLGQLAEQRGQLSQAGKHFKNALTVTTSDIDAGLVLRSLAKVALKKDSRAEAREFLNDALCKNPRDAAAMRMLAELYLQENEDPQIAEMLARKSVCLQDSPKGWNLLARALRALGKTEDALRAEHAASR